MDDFKSALEYAIALEYALQWYAEAPRDFSVYGSGCTHNLTNGEFVALWKKSGYNIQFVAKLADVITRALATDTVFLDQQNPTTAVKPNNCDGYANVAYIALHGPDSHRGIYRKAYDRFARDVRRHRYIPDIHSCCYHSCCFVTCHHSYC